MYNPTVSWLDVLSANGGMLEGGVQWYLISLNSNYQLIIMYDEGKRAHYLKSSLLGELSHY